MYHLSIRLTERHLRLLNNLNIEGQDQRFPKYFCVTVVMLLFCVDMRQLALGPCESSSPSSIDLSLMYAYSILHPKSNVATGRMQQRSVLQYQWFHKRRQFFLSLSCNLHMLSKYCSGFVVDLFMCIHKNRCIHTVSLLSSPEST